MLKNVTGQNLTAVLLDTAGAVVTTGTTTVYVTGDAGTQTSMGTATHEGNGQWSIDVTQAESNYDDIGFLWVNTGAVTINQHVFTDQSYDRLGAPAGASVSADVATVDSNVDAVLVDTGTTIPASLTTIDNEIAVIDGIVDNILVDTGTTLPASLTTIDNEIAVIDGIVDNILVDTAEIGAAGAGLTALSTQASVNTIDSNVDAVLVDTGTTIPATIATVDSNVDAILVDTGTTLPASIATIDTNVDTMVSGIITGAAATGTLSTTEATTNLTGYTADQLIGRTLTWTSGSVDGEQTAITDYAVTNGHLTFSAMTIAPSNAETFKIT